MYTVHMKPAATVDNLIRNCHFGDLPNIRSILKRDPGLASQADTFTGITPLMKSCMSGQLEAAKLLLSHGAESTIDALSSGDEGLTALHCAAIGSVWRGEAEMEMEMVALILDAGADPTAPDSKGRNCAELIAYRYSDTHPGFADRIRGLIARSERKALEAIADRPTPRPTARKRAI